MRKLFFGIVLLSVLQCPLLGQDALFYQSFAAPLSLNPAMSGQADGNYRISSIYRDQWRSLVDKPFSTFSIAADGKFSISDKRENSDYFGVGIHFTSDKVGVIAFSTNQLGLSTAYHKSLDKRLNQYLSFGVQIAFLQRNINYENLDFEDEFNGINAFTDASSEVLPVNNFGYQSLSMGLNYSISPTKYVDAFAGVSLYNAAGSVVSRSVNHRRYQAYTGFSYDLQNKWSIIPRAIYARQGPHEEMIVGSHFRHELIDKISEAIEFGTAVRLVNDIDGFGFESAILSLGIDLSGMLIGLSYEAGLNTVGNRFRNQGVFELSFRYVGNYDNDTFFCPKF